MPNNKSQTADARLRPVHPSTIRKLHLFAKMHRISDDRLSAAIDGAERRFKMASKGSNTAHRLACLIWDLRGERSDRARRGLPPLSGRPGHSGFERWCALAASWGYP